MISDSSSGSNFKFLQIIPKLIKYSGESGEAALNDPKMKKLMAEETFDLVMIGFFMQNFLLGVAGHFKCPSVIISSVGAMTASNVLIGNPLSVSGVPNVFLQYKEPMKFFQRVKNFMFYIIDFCITQIMEYNSKFYYE